MPEVDGTCEYVLDPDDPETWDGEEGDECYVNEEVLNEDGVWTCPHDAETGEELCIFHLPVTEKDDRETVDVFLEALNKAATNEDPKRRWLQFLGAKFAEFDLSDNPLDITIEDNHLVMDYAKITGALDWSDSIIDVSAFSLNGSECLDDAKFNTADFRVKPSFSGAEFNKKTSFGGTELKQGADFSDAEFMGTTHFIQAKFGRTTFRRAAFERDVAFDDAEFRGGTYFNNAEFGGEADFRRTEFKERMTRFIGTEFGAEADFRETEFWGNTSFSNMAFSGESKFSDATFGKITDSMEEVLSIQRTSFIGSKFRGEVTLSDAEFRTRADFRETEFGARADFSGTEFRAETAFNRAEFQIVDFRGAEFEGDTYFNYAEFGESTGFKNLILDGAHFNGADLTDVTFTGTSLWGANFELALLSRATLFGSDLRGTKLSGAVLGDVRIDEDTQFLGHPNGDSDSSPHTLSAIRSRPTCVYDSNYEDDNEHEDVDKAKSVYRALEELGRKHARPRLQARSFVRRQDLQKEEYKRDAKEAESWEERLIAGARWSRSKVSRMILLYGESPWRVISWSLGIIFGFAVLFPLGGWMKPEGGDPITYAQIATNPVEILNSFYYSTLTYTALGFGDFQPVGLGRLLTTVETGLGAVMLALLVFILGRRAAR